MEENRHAVLRKRPHPHLLRRGRFGIPPDDYFRRGTQLQHLIPGDGGALQSQWRPTRATFAAIAADLRNASGGQSSGPLEIDRPWDAYSEDQLGLMDHLGIEEFLVMGFCIGGPMIHNLLRLAPERIVAAAVDAAQRVQSGTRRTSSTRTTRRGGRRPSAKIALKVTMETVHDFLTSMYTDRADFVFTVSRDFVRALQTPLLIAPDDVPAHPYECAMEVASLAPELRGDHLPLERHPGEHRRSRGTMPAAS